MDLTPEEREYYARAFQSELYRAQQQERHIKAQAAQSFWAVFIEMVNRVAPHLWDKMKDVWEVIFRRWLRESD